MNSTLRSSIRGLAVAVLLGGAVSPVFGQTTWTNSGTGDWFTPGNWSAGVPTNSLVAMIRNGGTSRITGGLAVAAGASVGSGSGAGTLQITSGTFSTGGSIQLGAAFGGGQGTLLVSGSSARVTTTGSLLVGDAGVGVLTLADGTVSNATGFVGAGVGASGTATVSGGRWQNTGNLFIGDYGTGVLNISSGTVSNAMGLLGYNSGASGAALVSGGLWQNSGEIQVGNFGSGTLAVTGYGSLVHTDSIVRVGVNSGTGSITVIDEGVIEANQFVEGSGTGSIRIDGGTLRAMGNQANFFSGFEEGDVTVGNSSAFNTFIDTNGYNVGVGMALSGSGRFGKTGQGTLTMTGSNTFGNTVGVFDGTMALGPGGAITAPILSIVANPGSNPVFAMSGGKVTLSSGLSILGSGTGSVIQTGGMIANAGGTTVGMFGSGLGILTVSGGTLSSGEITVGFSGTGILNVSGGLVQGTTGYFGMFSNGSGVVSSGTLALSQDLYLGYSGGAGSLSITGGLVSNRNGIIGRSAPTESRATISGGTWQNSGVLWIGNTSNGKLDIDGGLVTSAGSLIGASTGVSGTVSVSGGQWQNAGELFIGDYGAGVLRISSGTVYNAGAGLLGYNSGASGAALISGGLWQNSGEIQVGNFGSGTLAVTALGTVVHTDSIVRVGVNSGTGSITVADGGMIEAGQFVEGAGAGSIRIDGGRLRATGNQANFFSGFEDGDITLGNSSSFETQIDTNGYEVGVGIALSGSGRFGKTGQGTLTLTGSNTFGNIVSVHGGTMALGPGGALTASGLSMTGAPGSNSVFAMSGGKVTLSSGLGIFGSVSGTGALVQSGGIITTQNISVSGNGVGVGILTVSGGTLSSSGDIYATAPGSATLNLAGGLVQGRAGYLGYSSSGSGVVSSGTLALSQDLNLGYSGGDGSLSITGGLVSNHDGIIGSGGSAGSVATISGGTWQNNRNLMVGYTGNGNLNIEGGLVTSVDGHVGAAVGVSGTTTVTGGRWQNTGDLTIGGAGTGVLSISSGTVSNVMGRLGYGQESRGTALISGGLWQSSGEIWVGTGGEGTLAVSGGIVHTDSIVRLGVISGTGSITVSGSGVVEARRFLEGDGTGSVSLQGGTIRALVNETDFFSGFETGDVVLDSGTSRIDTNGRTIGITASLSGTGTLEKTGTGSLALSGSSTYSGGTKVSGGTLVLAHAQAAGSGTLTVGSGATLHVNSDALAFSNAVILGGGIYERDLAAGTDLAGRFNATSSLSGGAPDTTASLLAGETSETATVQTSFSATSAASNDEFRVSDVYTLSGVPVVDDLTGETDLFVLQLSVETTEAGLLLGWLDEDTDQWTNAISGNFGNISEYAVNPFSGSFAQFQALHGDSLEDYVGAWGTTTSGGVTSVWAVLNHNSEFAIIPEPSSAALLLIGALAFARRRKNPQM